MKNFQEFPFFLIYKHIAYFSVLHVTFWRGPKWYFISTLFRNLPVMFLLISVHTLFDDFGKQIEMMTSIMPKKGKVKRIWFWGIKNFYFCCLNRTKIKTGTKFFSRWLFFVHMRQFDNNFWPFFFTFRDRILCKGSFNPFIIHSSWSLLFSQRELFEFGVVIFTANLANFFL